MTTEPHLRRTFAAVSMALASSVAAAAELGVVANPGFEQTGKRGLPALWHTWHGGGYVWNDSDWRDLKSDLLKRLCDRMAWTADPLPPRLAPW